MELKRLVIVGCGAAGLAACRELRTLGYDGKIIIVESSWSPPLSRPGLVRFVGGGLGLEAALRWQEGITVHLEDLGVEVLWGHRGERLTGDNDSIQVSSNDRAFYLPWEGLIVASGARPVMPKPFQGVDGVFCLDSTEEAVVLKGILEKRHSCTIVGGGPISCKLAYELASRGCRVSIVCSSAWLMRRVLDEHAGLLAKDMLVKYGVDIRLRTDVAEVRSKKSGKLLSLTDGTGLETDCLVVAKGKRPDVLWLQDSGIRLGAKGILADYEMKTTRERVWACGDCAEVYSESENTSFRNGTWYTAVMQGSAAGRSIMGAEVSYSPQYEGNVVTLAGTQFFSAGRWTNDHGIKVVVTKQGKRYGKFALQDSSLIGVLLVGQGLPMGLINRLMMSRIPIREEDCFALLAGDLCYAYSSVKERPL